MKADFVFRMFTVSLKRMLDCMGEVCDWCKREWWTIGGFSLSMRKKNIEKREYLDCFEVVCRHSEVSCCLLEGFMSRQQYAPLGRRMERSKKLQILLTKRSNILVETQLKQTKNTNCSFWPLPATRFPTFFLSARYSLLPVAHRIFDGRT